MRQQPRGPLPSPLPGPPGAHENPLPLRLWLSWDVYKAQILAQAPAAVGCVTHLDQVTLSL